MENKTNINNDNIVNSKSGNVTSPINQKRLVSKVNALTSSSQSNLVIKPQNIVFNNEKGSTLNYKLVVDELVKTSGITNIAEFYIQAPQC